MKVYSRHYCEAHHRTERTFLKCALRRLEWVHGRGDIALIAWCKYVTVTLYGSVADAEKAKTWIDNGGCGGGCHKSHDIVRIQLNK